MVGRVLRALVSLGLAVAALAGCGDDDEPVAGPSTSAGAITTSSAGATTTVPEGGEHECAPGVTSSPSAFDPVGGLYATYLTGVDAAARTVTFDVVQWLSGDDAKAAYVRDHPDEPDGPPNDYYIVNASPEVRTAGVEEDAEVWLVRLEEDANASLDPGTFGELPAYLAGKRPSPADGRLSASPIWLDVAHGAVRSICEQYVP